MKRVLYLTRNGLLEPLGRSQILPYLSELSSVASITLISFEKSIDWHDHKTRFSVEEQCRRLGIRWIRLRFRADPRPLMPALAIAQLGLVAIWECWFYCKPDLIHARSYVPAGIAMLLRLLVGVPFIFDMRALWPEELITAGRLRRGSSLHRYLCWLELLCLQHASGVVTLTRAAAVHLQITYPHEKVCQRVVVIPTCADLQRFQFASPAQVPPLVFSCIGTVLSGWFLIGWLRAFLDAVDRVEPTARFELISRDSPDQILKALNPSPAWSDRLVIQSATPEEMPSILSRHSASVLFYAGGATSELGRSPTRMAEVLACGRPVVANPGVGDLEQQIKQYRVGVLARGSSASDMYSLVVELLELLKDPQLPQRCRKTAEKLFSLENGAAAYRQLYSDILS